ncbi:D-glycero-beta-D-manno-heptose 1-phosphate adenylyltransferase [Fuchsiella alkaliacetigena]|uniref:D-glycero-beta-D-manno-heptose 1-phosphate adenylyltransferase n=1 Tax=Fuchsiella alkaliacetigena TaxID=957042 RepID=UPI00200B7E67|nr:D-glycero-beta-D-manno-heptose 1-phosphate adenylyltransferase [Fuchsiella alkaliacetigena]MCK8824316.1 D-glycero-beta-D-manno-heptose 1-phosphate adenylyltransferase [Fuchsiella alkaliacetigena]
MLDKLVKLAELKEVLQERRRAKQKIVFTNGCFDILHVGHVRYLQAAQAKGDLLVVGINSDTSVKQLKGEQRPVVPEEERAEMLAALEMVDYVVIFEELTAKRVIGELKPDIYVKGGDYSVEELPEAEVVASYGGKIELVKEVKGASTTNIVEEIQRINDR